MEMHKQVKLVVLFLWLFYPLSGIAAVTANAGPDATFAAGVPIVLNGGNSSDSGGAKLKFLWEQVSGPSLDLLGRDHPKALVISTSTAGSYLFRLQVSNGVETAQDEVVITIVESVGRRIYVDQQLPSSCTGSTYSIASRDCSGSDGIGFKTLQEAANVSLPGDTIVIRGGTYPTIFKAAGVQLETLNISRSGTPSAPIRYEAFQGERVLLEGLGFEDRDLNMDGSADGPKFPSKRETLVLIRADYIQIRGLELYNSQQAGMLVEGSFCYIENVISRDNWFGNFDYGNATASNHRQGIVFRYCEAARARHAGGFQLLGTLVNAGFTVNCAIVDSLIHNNGFQPDGAKVLPIGGDPAGGGNSDGIVVSKNLYDAAAGHPTVANFAFDNYVIRNVVYHNADDGIDISFEHSMIDDNISIENGPAGTQGVKMFTANTGLSFRGNILYKNLGRGLELRVPVGGVITVQNNTMVRNLGNGMVGTPVGSEVKNNLGAFNHTVSGNADLSTTAAMGGNNWAADGLGVPVEFKGNPLLVHDDLAFSLPSGAHMTIREKLVAIRNQFELALMPKAGSPLIDKGVFVAGYHCPRADDDPVSPMPKGAPGKHWYGAAPDIGAVEFNPYLSSTKPAAPKNLRVVP